MNRKRWSTEKANDWYAKQPWLVGSNFLPSSAINQLEMWQADTFDPETIDRELGWAADLGMNTARVFLHDLVWEQDAVGFKERIDQYLEIATGHGIATMLVFFDDCWNPNPKPGKQPEPVVGRHNSGWMQSPGMAVLRKPSSWSRLEDYVCDIVQTFGADERVLIWDIYNEPGNYFMPLFWQPSGIRQVRQIWQLLLHLTFPIPTLKLMEQAFGWVRAEAPQQPLTTALYYILPTLGSKLNRPALELSDLVSFHYYYDLEATLLLVKELKQHGRPLLCTEYLSRTTGNHFENLLPLFKHEKIGCYNWGLVSGKSQTHCINTLQSIEPPVWGADILRADGSPYREWEAEALRKWTGLS